MNPFDPFNLFHLSGQGTLRYVTLALPTATVRNLLPAGLELGPQVLTPAGTHPVLLGFHEMFRLHTSVPSLLPSMTYHEHSVGVPYCYVTQPRSTSRRAGPYFFMPSVLLDNVLATLGGLLFWGYAKRLATFRSAEGRYSVTDTGGEAVLSLGYEYVGDAQPVAQCPHFELQRQALAQTIISTYPLGMGPFFVLAEFPKRWEVATVRPLSAVTEIFTDYVVGLPSGRYPSAERSAGIDVSPVGAYELRAPWQLSSPYPLMAV